MPKTPAKAGEMKDEWLRAYRLAFDNQHVRLSDETSERLVFRVTLGMQGCFAELIFPKPSPEVGAVSLEAGYRGGVYRTIFDGDIVNRQKRGAGDWRGYVSLVARRHVPMQVPDAIRPVIDASSGLIGTVETKRGTIRARMLLRADLVPGSMAELPGGMVCRIVGLEHTGDSRNQPWYTDIFGYAEDG